MTPPCPRLAVMSPSLWTPYQRQGQAAGLPYIRAEIMVGDALRGGGPATVIWIYEDGPATGIHFSSGEGPSGSPSLAPLVLWRLAGVSVCRWSREEQQTSGHASSLRPSLWGPGRVALV